MRRELLQHPADTPFGRDPTSVPNPFANFAIVAISPDRQSLLLAVHSELDSEKGIWTLPLAGASPRRIESGHESFAAWSPGRRTLAVSHDFDIETMDAWAGAAANCVNFATVQPLGLQLRPDGRRIRFEARDPVNGAPGLWEVNADAIELHRIRATKRSLRALGEGQCCGH